MAVLQGFVRTLRDEMAIIIVVIMAPNRLRQRVCMSVGRCDRLGAHGRSFVI